MGSQEEIKIENDFILFIYKNDESNAYTIKRPINKGLLQFHFGVKGKGKFIFNEGNYALELREEKSLLLYNPQKELPLVLEMSPKSSVITVLISIQKFHGLFSNESSHIPFLSVENKDEKYYKENQISPSMAIVLSQLIHYNLNPSLKNLYYKGKAYELMSLFFNRAEDANTEQCPFLIDEEK